MAEAREIMDIYTGSEENEQFDMWFSNRELRPQFEAIDHILSVRGGKNREGGRDTGIWHRLARLCPRTPGHVRDAGV